jgi:hypothetical protein
VARAPVLGLLVLAFALFGCARIAYDATETGTFSGRLQIRWIAPDRFIYLPDPRDPLRFVTSDKHQILPGLMYTDGGSIPRLLWSAPGLSPWGYGPAYIVHDWLFAAKHCANPAYGWVTFPESARLLGEAIKTLMVQKAAPESPTLMYLIVEAVRSPVAREIWEQGACLVPPPEVEQDAAVGAAPVIMTIDMTNLPRR